MIDPENAQILSLRFSLRSLKQDQHPAYPGEIGDG
jgi:hypothetical protein